MPVSKKRKKKKKKSNKNSDKQVTVVNGMKIVRKGNTIFTHNQRTAEQHQEFLDQIEIALPKVLEGINDRISEVFDIFEKYDNIELLGALSCNDIFKKTDRIDDGLSEVILEYGMSVSSSIPEKADREPPTPEVLQNMIEILGKIRDNYNGYYVHESVLNGNTEGKDPQGLNDLKIHVITESLNIRGVGYYVHVEQLFLEMFSLHDKFLSEKYGFTAHDFIKALNDIETSCLTRIPNRWGGPHPILEQRFMNWAQSKRIFPPPFSITPKLAREFQQDNPDVYVDENGIRLFKINEIGSYHLLFKIICTSLVQEKVVDALSLEFGQNEKFAGDKIKGHLLASTQIHEKPFLKNAEGDSFIFSNALASRNYLTIGQALIKDKDPAYYNKKFLGKAYEICRDRFIERKIEELFRSLLPEVMFYPNVRYPLPETHNNSIALEMTELDLLGIGPNETYLIEVKAGEFNDSARRGAVESMVSRLKKNVGKGVYQSQRAENHIRLNDVPYFIEEGKGNQLPIDKSKKIYKIIVTLDSFSGLLTRIDSLEEAEIIDATDDSPWIIHIYDLMVFADIIESAKDFNDYLDKRIPLNKWKAFSTQDELNLLGCFFEEGLVFKKHIKHLDNFTVGRYLHDFDSYYNALQMGRTIAKPKRKNFK